MEQVLKQYINVSDNDKIFYDGVVNGDVYAITITSRKKVPYSLRFLWREALYKYLHSIKFKGCLVGVMEQHETDRGTHFHGFATGKLNSKPSHDFFIWSKIAESDQDIRNYAVYTKKGRKNALTDRFSEIIFNV